MACKPVTYLALHPFMVSAKCFANRRFVPQNVCLVAPRNASNICVLFFANSRLHLNSIDTRSSAFARLFHEKLDSKSISDVSITCSLFARSRRTLLTWMRLARGRRNDVTLLRLRCSAFTLSSICDKKSVLSFIQLFYPQKSANITQAPTIFIVRCSENYHEQDLLINSTAQT